MLSICEITKVAPCGFPSNKSGTLWYTSFQMSYSIALGWEAGAGVGDPWLLNFPEGTWRNGQWRCSV